jgi:hypothetical protein
MRYLALALLVGCHGSNRSIEIDAPAAPDAASCVWSPPVELTEFSDAAIERDPTETADRLELYYASNPAGAIQFASRASADAAFERQPLPSFDDPAATESSPVISADGLHIVFTSDRSGTLAIYESTRASRDTSWSAPELALGGGPWMVGTGGIGMTTDGLNLVFELETSAHCFTRHETDKPFMPNCNDLFVMPSPAFDDAFTTIYYNCASGICARSLIAWPNFKTPDDVEEHVATGTPSGAADPWVEPGGDTILFAADHSLFRTTRTCI